MSGNDRKVDYLSRHKNQPVARESRNVCLYQKKFTFQVNSRTVVSTRQETHVRDTFLGLNDAFALQEGHGPEKDSNYDCLLK